MEKLSTVINYVTYLTDPTHGGKITCHKCSKFIVDDGDAIGYRVYQTRKEFPKAWFHKYCFNQYEHYYGLDKAID